VSRTYSGSWIAGASDRQQTPKCCHSRNHGLLAFIASCLRFAAATSLGLSGLMSGVSNISSSCSMSSIMRSTSICTQYSQLCSPRGRTSTVCHDQGNKPELEPICGRAAGARKRNPERSERPLATNASEIANLKKRRSPASQNRRAFAARNAAGRPARKTTGSASAVIRGIPLRPETSTQHASITGLKHSAFLAVAGRCILFGMRSELCGSSSFWLVTKINGSPDNQRTTRQSHPPQDFM